MATLIGWAQETWNPVTGCSKVSAGCKNCYAENLSLRKGWSKLPWTGPNAAQNVVLHEDRLTKPIGWKKPKMVFVNSMSDLFHPLIPLEFVDRVFQVMRMCSHHTFMVLTKRPENAAAYPVKHGGWPQNVWAGTSIEDRKNLPRLADLLEVNAVTRFLSLEPLLEDLGRLDLEGIKWVIAGGESGPDWRPMDHAWARNIRDACTRQGVAFFFKQSAHRMPERGRALLEENGEAWEWNQFPGQMTPPKKVDPVETALIVANSLKRLRVPA